MREFPQDPPLTPNRNSFSLGSDEIVLSIKYIESQGQYALGVYPKKADSGFLHSIHAQKDKQ